MKAIDIWPGNFPGPEDWARKLGEMFAEAQRGMLKKSVELLLQHSAPSFDTIQSDWFGFILGAWFGLAQQMIKLIIIVVAVLVLLGPTRDHSKKLAALMTSVVQLLVFVTVFYPAYKLAMMINGKVGGIIVDKFVTGDGKGDLAGALAVMMDPKSAVGILGSSFVGWCVYLTVMGIVVGLNIAALAALSFYPMAIIFRPIRFGEGIFHLSNAVVVTTILSGPFMILWLAIAYWVASRSEIFMPGSPGTLGILSQTVAGIMAGATPFIIFYFAFKKSSEVWGKIDSNVEGAMGVTASEPLTVREANKRVEDNHFSMIRDVAIPAAVATIDDKPGEPMSRRLADIVAAGALAAGHPEIAAAAQVVKSRIPIPDQPVQDGGVK